MRRCLCIFLLLQQLLLTLGFFFHPQGASASLPNDLNEEQAKTLCGDKFDQVKFDSMKSNDGTVEKSAIMAQYDEAASTASTVSSGRSQEGISREMAEAESQGDM